jgi:Lsr2
MYREVSQSEQLTIHRPGSTMPSMAQRVVVEKTDDTNGEPAVETVSFGIDGRELEIDLTAKNAAALRKIFDRYIKHGRRVGGRRLRPAPSAPDRAPARPSQNGEVDTKAVRQWAGDHGYTVSARGRIPADVVQAYRTANTAPSAASDTASKAMNDTAGKTANKTSSNTASKASSKTSSNTASNTASKPTKKATAKATAKKAAKKSARGPKG